MRGAVEEELHEVVVDRVQPTEDTVDAFPPYVLPEVLVGEVCRPERVHALQPPRGGLGALEGALQAAGGLVLFRLAMNL